MLGHRAQERPIAHRGMLQAMAFAARGCLLATAGKDGWVRLWQLGNLEAARAMASCGDALL